jgi:hypothetical protein
LNDYRQSIKDLAEELVSKYSNKPFDGSKLNNQLKIVAPTFKDVD